MTRKQIKKVFDYAEEGCKFAISYKSSTVDEDQTAIVKSLEKDLVYLQKLRLVENKNYDNRPGRLNQSTKVTISAKDFNMIIALAKEGCLVTGDNMARIINLAAKYETLR